MLDFFFLGDPDPSEDANNVLGHPLLLMIILIFLFYDLSDSLGDFFVIFLTIQYNTIQKIINGKTNLSSPQRHSQVQSIVQNTKMFSSDTSVKEKQKFHERSFK